MCVCVCICGVCMHEFVRAHDVYRSVCVNIGKYEHFYLYSCGCIYSYECIWAFLYFLLQSNKMELSYRMIIELSHRKTQSSPSPLNFLLTVYCQSLCYVDRSEAEISKHPFAQA